MAGIIRQARRPPGWVPPGPAPRGFDGRPELEPQDNEDLCFLAGDWRIYQQQTGHRWSMDDLLTAYLASESVLNAPPKRGLDLGTGLGSVLMLLAWKYPQASFTGIEAQAERAALARRSLAFNGADERCSILNADLRAAPVVAPFDLITGTPPYFPIGTGTQSEKPTVAPCRFEHRGGVETYLEVAAENLGLEGTFVMCAAYAARERIDAAFPATGLHLHDRWNVVPKVGKAPLLTVDVFRWQAVESSSVKSICVRDAKGQWTTEFQRVRASLGLPPNPQLSAD